MATKSFTDTYIIERSDVNRFHNIMSKPKKVKVKKVMNHQDVKGKAIVDMLGIKKSWYIEQFHYMTCLIKKSERIK